jgi:hypothetical protein
MANLTLRSSTGQPLSFAELDGNFEYFTGSHAVTGSITATQGFIGDVTGTASYATSTSSSLSASYAITSSYAVTASHAITSSYAVTASYALNGGGGGSTNTGSLVTTASFSDPNLTFTKGDGSTFNVDISTLTVNNAVNATTAIFANTAGVATSAVIASSATTANTAVTANTASYVQGANVDGIVSNAVTSSYVTPLVQDVNIIGNITASVGANFQTIEIGTSGTINGQNILTTANTSQFVTSVNGILPTAGNVSVSLAAVVTGDSASLVASGSGAVTGSFSQGLLWVVSQDLTPANNGDVYIFTTSSGAGQWLSVAPLDTAAGDARYVRQQGDGAITGSFAISGSGVTIELLGDTKINEITDASFLPSIDPNNRKLRDSLGNLILDYENKNFYGTSDTASYVNLVAGPNVTINQVGTSFEISGSAGGGGFPGGGGNSIQYNDGMGGFGGATAFSYNTANGSVNQGSSNVANGNYSHVQGTQNSSSVLAQYSHAEGQQTTTVGFASHTEGYLTVASGAYSHAEGWLTISSGSYSHAEGRNTQARGNNSHAEGQNTTATGIGSHAEGVGNVTIGNFSHAEGSSNTAQGASSHAEGFFTLASGLGSHAEGYLTVTSGSNSHAEGNATRAAGQYSHAEGYQSYAIGNYSHAEGYRGSTGLYAWNTTGTVNGLVSIVSSAGNVTSYLSVGNNVAINNTFQTIASSTFLGGQTLVQLVDTTINLSSGIGIATLFSAYVASQLPGQTLLIKGQYAHAEGLATIAFGDESHAEGLTNIAFGGSSHAEGESTIAIGNSSHAEGQYTLAKGYGSHAEGNSTEARGYASHAEGEGTIAIGDHSHAEGHYNIASADYQTVVGIGNITSSVQGAFIIGNGTPFSYSYLQSNLLHAGGNTVEITGSLDVTGSLISRNTTILTQVSESLNFIDDAAAATGGVPLGGLYRNGSFIQIRIA